MIPPKTSIRLLKYLGIGLVALPEPVTTAFGVAFLVGANYLSRHSEADPERHRFETSPYFPYWFKRPEDYADVETGAPVAAKSYSQNETPPTPWPQETSRRLEAGPTDHHFETSPYFPYWFKRPEDYADVETSIPVAAKSHSQSQKFPTPWPQESSRRLAADGPSGWQNWYNTKFNVAHHAIDLPMLYRRYGMKSVEAAKKTLPGPRRRA